MIARPIHGCFPCLAGPPTVLSGASRWDGFFCDPRHEQRFDNMTAHGHYIVPLMHAATPVGIMFLYTDPYPDRDETRLEQLRMVGELMGIAIVNDRLRGQLERAKERPSQAIGQKASFWPT